MACTAFRPGYCELWMALSAQPSWGGGGRFYASCCQQLSQALHRRTTGIRTAGFDVATALLLPIFGIGRLISSRGRPWTN
jgi:hypothetical protein